MKDETGAVSAIVAIFVSSLLLFGSLALAVDSGVMHLERRTVVNAAQSTALALAKQCVDTPNNCAASPAISNLVNANSPDGLTSITELCISGKNSFGQPCQGLTTNSLDCAAIPAQVKSFVRVRTESQSSESGVGVRTYFSSETAQSLRACAQARWGNAGSAQVFSPFAVSICEWAKQQSLPRTLLEFKSSDGVSSCTYSFTDLANQSFTKSGINGWAAVDLQSSSLPTAARASTVCPNPTTDQPATLRIGYQLNQITRDQSSSNYCGDSDLLTKIVNWLNITLYIPLVSTEKISGGSTIHTVEAFAAFKLLGFSLLKGNGSAQSVGGIVPTGNWCQKNTNCIYGEFISTISPNSDVTDTPGVPSVGLQAIKLF